MLSLSIQHNIHLTREERYALHEGEDIITVGVSIPVWFMDKLTTEPAKEIFCNYYLKNPKKDIPIQILEDGYEITIPHRQGGSLNMPNEEWRNLNLNHPDKLDALYKQVTSEVSSKCLLDVIDGGSAGMAYREHNKIKRGDKMLDIKHFVCFSTREQLVGSLI